MARAKILLMTLALILGAAPSLPAQDVAADDEARPGRTLAAERSRKASRAPVSQAWWLGTTVMILALGGAGALCVAARRQCSNGAAVKLQVVGRVHLPPRHAVFAVKAGGRTLLIGTGPQGAPTLLGELDDEPAEALAQAQSPAVTVAAPHAPIHPRPRFDVRIGDES
ncbi:flagellar biosynthetic protein FliO [Paludisphaera sp.]|uniref:flagellar biosynthetic protein FliO n=1 Tax=Paludisphaera sp. TaxID=2017432 RepID=UPI00301DFAD1